MNFTGRRSGALLHLAAAQVSLLLCAFQAPAHADGPGLPNLSYSSNEVFKPLVILRSDVNGSERGHGTVQMVNGYLFVPFGRDSGASGGGFSFYDMSNPRAPVKVSQTNVTALREPHGFGFSNSYPGRYAVMQSISGIQFWDFTNALAPTLLNSMTLPGIAESDYALGAWWAFWQAPYVYVGGSGNGIYVVDARDPRNPVLVNQVSTSAWGGFRVGPVFAVGNLLVGTNTDASGLVTLDIGDPVNPRVLASTTATAGQYSGIVNGERIVTAGTDNRLHVYDISNPLVFNQVAQSSDQGGKGGYVSTQRGFAHAGFSTKYAKVNLSDGSTAGTGSSNIASRDEDFGTVFGNLVLVGNDHGNGSALMPHQTGPVTGAPAVNMVSPKNNATNQPVTSRVGITLTDQIDLRTVSNSSFIVRQLGGPALAGKYSGQSGILNFSPDVSLLPGTTYEVVVTAGGMKDDVGNGVAAFTSRFTTAGTAPGVACTLGPRTAALVGSTVSFSPASASGSNLQYAWNFGDGSSTAFSGTPSASRAYAAPAHYPVILTVRSGSVSSTCSATQTIHTQPTATAPRSSSTIAFDAGRNRVWVVNSDNDSVTAINAANNTRLFEQGVGVNPQTLAQAPDGRIWVANAGSGSISVLDPASGALVQTIALGLGTRPFGVVFNPLGTAAFITLQGSGRVLKLHPGTGAVQASLSAGTSPRGLAISGDSNRLLVTRYISPLDRGEVVEVNPSAFAVTRTFALATDPGPDTEGSGRGVPNFLSAVTIQPDGKRAWIPSKKDNTLRGTFRDGNALTFESTVRTIVSQIDLDNNAEVLSARRDLNDRDMANAVTFTPLGDYAFISTQGTNQIEVMDTYNRQLVAGLVNVGRAPRGLLITPNGRLYVQNFMSRNVSVYDVSGLLNATSNTAPKVVDIAAVGGEALAANVFNGKRIFYNADDRRMNRDKYISCASCHQDGGHDGRTMDFTDRGEGLRNTIPLNGRRGTGQGRVHWTANFNEIQDFEHDIRNNFGGTGFLSDAQFNTGTRNTPLGDPKAGLNSDLDALAAYVNSLSSVGRSPFRNADGSLTAAAVAGQQIFNGSGQCGSCHSGADFTDSASGVLRDVGTLKASSGKRLGATLTGLDTPTLKGLWDTAPYLHDGSAATLLDVLTTANPAGRHGTTSGLNATQLSQLVAYLQQIDDGVDATTPVAISNLSVKDTANAADWSVQNSLQNGALQYGDRTYTFTTVPSIVVGGRWIRTANDSKAFTGDPTVTFNISQTADVLVAIDDRVGARPWMTGWINTGQKLVNNEGEPKSFTLFRKNFPAGAVSLGPSSASGSMYTIVVK
ncbi:MAG: Ig-like domain-containing protein [Cytophagales bacterium]|nr:Ig-like domain-containing protein [Rhizobacter sp.]